MNKRKIAVFTGNRAEYGLQLPILKAIDAHPQLHYQLIVSGAHLNTQFGHTLDEIRADGFHIDAEVTIDMGNTVASSTAVAIGNGIIAMTKTLAQLAPDIVVVYADRFEGFAAVIAATQMHIPTAHIEGGDLTEGGALDDSVRHAMSKLAHLHFTTNQQAANRLLAMGEETWRVHTAGFPAIDLIAEKRYANPQDIVKKLSLTLAQPIVVFTQHSVSSEYQRAKWQIIPSIKALKALATKGVQVIVTYPNNDAGGDLIVAALEQLKKDTANRLPIQVHASLGHHLYHGLLALAKQEGIAIACVGNSSSGIKETPAFCCPTVNIGTRQKGRLRSTNVLDVDYDEHAIQAAVEQCLGDANFKAHCKTAKNPYFLGGAGRKIAEILATVDINTSLLQKAMTLKGESENGWFR
ncbi:UDP-N-acetylglucosamine 2-epimerase [Teredinibacter purpureus]|uniref:UDP-N-acetylglucosamine 2-epimerase n=1 Tax=Teredinibacter purpureus TaxID=2731756 RepID=UPI00191064BC|nr:UDP-N-acetylglucosamine 2-epimerase [Teredinibacter purpureus]